MKKVILAALALGAFATANAQTSTQNSQASDMTTLNLNVTIENVIVLNPECAQNLNVTYTIDSIKNKTGNLAIGHTDFSVWSNREYNVSYQVGNTNSVSTPGYWTGGYGPYHYGGTYHPGSTSYYLTYADFAGEVEDGDENNQMPIGNIMMQLTNTSGLSGTVTGVGGGSSNTYTAATLYNSPSSILGGGTHNIINEAAPTGNAHFTLDFTMLNPSYTYVGGHYNCSVNVTATQE